MPAYVTKVASGQLASYDAETMVAMFVDGDGKAAIESAALANGTVDIATLSELTAFELARTTFTAEVDETLGKIDVAADEDPTADTDGDTVAGVVIARNAGGSDAARTVVACHTFTARAGNAADAVVFSNENGFASWEPAPGAIVRGIGTVRPDAEGIINDDELAALLEAQAAAGGGAPVMVYAEAGEELDLSASTDVWTGIVVAASSGVEANRPHIRLPHPADDLPAARMSLVPAAANPGNGSLSNYGATIYYREDTPGVLGDLAALTPTDLGAGETFTLGIGASTYDATLTGDYTGNLNGLILDLVTAWAADGAPIDVPATVQNNLGYYSPVAQEWFTAVAVTTVLGSSATVSIVDAGAGDPIGLAGLTTIDGETDWAIGINLTQEGTGQENVGGTHTWQDRTSVRFMQRLELLKDSVGPFPQWAATSTRVDAPFLPYGPVTPGDWTEGAPSYVGNALDILAARSGGGGGGSVATDSLWDAAGDLAVGTGANTAAKLTKGTSGHFLKAGASTLSWAGIANTDVSGLGGAAVLNVGTSTGTVAAGDDARFVHTPVNLGAGTTLTSTGSNVLASLLPSTPTVYGVDGDVLHVNAVVRILNNTGSNQTAFDVQVKLGSTTIWDGTGYTLSTSANPRYAWLRLIIPVGTSNVTRNAIGSLTFASLTPTQDYGANTADLTSGQAFDIVGRTATGSAAEEIQCMWATVVRNRA